MDKYLIKTVFIQSKIDVGKKSRKGFDNFDSRTRTQLISLESAVDGMDQTVLSNVLQRSSGLVSVWCQQSQ